MPRDSRYRYSAESTARQPEPQYRPRRPRPRPIRATKKTRQSFAKVHNARYINQKGKYWLKLPIQIVCTGLVVFACAMAIVLFNGQITGTQRDVSAANSTFRSLQETNRNLAAQIGGAYTLEEIEFYAVTELGMTLPDPAQVIEINVPMQSYAVLSTHEFLPHAENFRWQDVSTFVRAVFDRLFG